MLQRSLLFYVLSVNSYGKNKENKTNKKQQQQTHLIVVGLNVFLHDIVV